MISSGRCSARRSAQSVLPVPVGPVSMTTGFFTASAPSEEKLIQFGEGQAGPRRAAVVALIRAIGGFHLSQQCVHLGQRQAAMRVDGGSARQRAEELVCGAVEVMRAGFQIELAYHGVHDVRDVLADE